MPARDKGFSAAAAVEEPENVKMGDSRVAEDGDAVGVGVADRDEDGKSE